MAVIEKGRQLMTLVNVFTVKPDKQAGLADFVTLSKAAGSRWWVEVTRPETPTKWRQAPSRGI